MSLFDSENAQLDDWGEIRTEFKDAAILIGNGASQAIWSRFRYGSLFQVACGDSINHALGPTDLVYTENKVISGK